MTKVTHIKTIRAAGMNVKLIWDEKTLREHGASALYVPEDCTIYLHPIYRKNKLETMKCIMHEVSHIIERYMNISLEESTLDAVAQGNVVILFESGLLDPDNFEFGVDKKR
jgi:hypothetical protein